MISQATGHSCPPPFVPLSSEERERLQARGASWVRGMATTSRPTLRLYRQPRTRMEPMDSDALPGLLSAFHGVSPQAWSTRSVRRSLHSTATRDSSVLLRSNPIPAIPDSLRMSAVESQQVDFGPRLGSRVDFRAEHGAAITALPGQVSLTGEGFSLWYRVSPALLAGKTASPLALLGEQAVLGLFCSKFYHPGSNNGRAAEQLVELTPVVLVQTAAGRALEPMARVVDAATRDEVLKRLAWQQPRELASLTLDASGPGFQLSSQQGSGKEVLDVQVGEASWLARLRGASLRRSLLNVLEKGVPVGGQVRSLRTAETLQVQLGRLESCVIPERMHRGLLADGAQPELVLLFPRLQVQAKLGREG